MSKLLPVLIALGAANVGASTGNDRGNGVEDAVLVHAWFLGAERNVRYCVEADNYAASFVPDYLGAVEGVFASWVTYLAEKKVNDPSRYDDVVGDARLPTRFTRIREGGDGACEGSDADLVIYLGARNEKVDHALEGRTGPKGVAILETYDAIEGWGKGFVWVAAPTQYNSPTSLAGVLLHEIGHVLGNAHVPGTIMRADLGDYLGAYLGADEALLHGQIDHEAELVTCLSCRVSRQLPLSSAGLRALWGRIAGFELPAGSRLELGGSAQALRISVISGSGQRAEFRFVAGGEQQVRLGQGGGAFWARKAGQLGNDPNFSFGGTFSSPRSVFTAKGSLYKGERRLGPALLEANLRQQMSPGSEPAVYNNFDLTFVEDGEFRVMW
jgi:hypothetical protein